MSDKEILNSKLIAYNFNPCNAGNIQSVFQVINQSLTFNPDYYRVEQFSVSISNANDNLYVLNSSLTDNEPIISFTGRTTFAVNMNEGGILRSFPDQLSFNLAMLGQDSNSTTAQNTTGLARQITPTFPQNGGANPTNCFVSISVNYFKFKSSKH